MGRSPDNTVQVRLSLSFDAHTKLQRLANALNVPVRADLSRLGYTLSLLLERVETPDDLMPEYLRLARSLKSSHTSESPRHRAR